MISLDSNTLNSISSQILSLFRTGKDKEDLIERIVTVVHEKTQFEAVGLRLRDGLDFPYYFTRGFDQVFVEKENSLCATDIVGEIIRDSEGNPLLECMCGNIIMGRTDPSLEFFTEGGSFWSNCTTELLASTNEEERQARTRNRCNGEGYESVALIPLKESSNIHGLLQLNDSRRDRFTLEIIEFLEGVANSIALLFAMREARSNIREQADEVARQASVKSRLLKRIAEELSKEASEIAPSKENLFRQLMKIIEEMETVKGLIPICSYCKKVRTDKGYWQNVEEYVSARASARFSHAYCPDCYEKLCRELDLKEER